MNSCNVGLQRTVDSKGLGANGTLELANILMNCFDVFDEARFQPEGALTNRALEVLDLPVNHIDVSLEVTL